MAQRGWYPDPAGEPGMFRYWDGASWSATVSPTPLPGPPSPIGAPPPPPAAGSAGSTWFTTPTSGQSANTTAQNGNPQGVPPASGGSQGAQPVGGAVPSFGPGSSAPSVGGYDPTRPIVMGSAPGAIDQSTSTAYHQFQAMDAAKAKKPVGMWVTIGVGVVILALIVWAATRIFGGTSGGGQTDQPIPNPTVQTCPNPPASVERADHPSDGRVYGGQLSFPKLGQPWSDVRVGEDRIPFGRDTAEQDIVIHANYDGLSSWVASVVVGELNAGDGFYAPKQASEIVNRCIFGAFYGDTAVQAETLKSEAYSVDGFDGWITETNLSFSIPNLATTSEKAIVIIVQTSAMSSSIFYASIPNDAEQYLPDVEQAIAGLHVTR